MTPRTFTTQGYARSFQMPSYSFRASTINKDFRFFIPKLILSSPTQNPKPNKTLSNSPFFPTTTTIMSTTTTTSAQIIGHTTAFISETISQSELRHRLVSTFRHKIPSWDQITLKTLNLAAETLEKAISTTNNSARSSSLRLAEKLLLSYSENPFCSFLLSLTYSLCHRPIDAALSLLDIFYTDPNLARLEIASVVFEELFLMHFLPLLQWYNNQRSKILLSLSTNDNDDKGGSISSTRLLSNMSGYQASELKELERDYEKALDENCKVFVGYFKELLGNNDGTRRIDPPSLVMRIFEEGNKFKYSKDENIKAEESGLQNGRYNPIWAEGENSVELHSGSGKSLTKFPSFCPERVSPQILMKQRSSRKLKASPKRDSDFELESSSDAHLSDSSSSDSEVETEENKGKLAFFNPIQSQSHKYKLSFSAESSRSPDPLMAEIDNPPGGGKNTPPKDFVCPITSHIFDDPVTLETGQTYERKAIQEWLDRGNSSCPITRQKLHNSHLPKTNYVLKRLIASWLEQNPSSTLIQSENSHQESEQIFNPVMHSTSPNSVITQATIDGTVSELRLAITNLCMSEILEESETAVLRIERFWKEAILEVEIQTMLSKPPVINGFVEILFNSVDPRVLRATVFLLSELGSRDNGVIQTLTQVDSDVECVVALFNKGLHEAVVLIYLLRPSTMSLVEMDMVDSLLMVISKKENDLLKMCMKPKTASVLLLGQILGSAEESTVTEIVRSVISEKVVESIVNSLEAEWAEERIAAVGILLRCMQEDGKCRNVIADKAELAPVLGSFIGANDGERFEIVHFLSELVKLNRRTFNEQILHIIKDEGTFSTMHTLLIYLQTALQDQCAVVAGLLLQLDLLVEPRKMSIYREEAIDTLISCLRNSDFPAVQIAAAETILSLQGRFSSSGEPLLRAFLLKRAGLEKSYRSLMRKEQLSNKSGEIQETLEEEKAADEWERRMAFVLVSHEFGLLFEALSEGLKSRYAELCSACFVSATWLVHMLTVLPDTGLRGAARVCLLKRFVSIFKSAKDTEDRALSMLALNSFIRDPEGLQDLTSHMKDILKGLRELKKSSVVAFDMLKVLSEGHESSADMWNHKELVEEDCSINGEVLSIACFKEKIISGHSDGTIKVWTGNGRVQLVQETREHTKAVTSLAILQSGERLYSGSLDRSVRVWTIGNEVMNCIQIHDMKEQVNNLVVANSISCFIPQGAGVKLHSWNGGSKLLNPNKYAKCLALSHGKLYCGCHNNSIQEIDLTTGTICTIQNGSRKLIGKANPVHALQVHEGLVYSASSPLDGAAVKIWSASNYNMIGSLPSTLEVRAMAISSELIYLGCKGGIVEVWCRKKHVRVETLQTGGTSKVLCMALDRDEVLVIGTSDGRIQAWGLS
ncbi:putative E3 ubiquitin-protein ligase LIN [Cornus florida]|uniref:putative E3 ubiquitin-protein ligase LIN n=1 Tax=Cornus florida TaxID=4283 RepID=UPI002898E907|nr:putative E3 ubiquitin-protein ligase LIN [Cornus florida]